ncbi:MAG: hypothetical protein JWM72_2472 [Actinomycetia bacterium]|nr:hypothetical protein [Actinomycetes bacterium]MDQ1460910.1 hypothetical protein [Actinomycetota bacterium]
MNTTIGELASLVRSKNAGPFWITIDIFLPNAAAYDRAATSPVTDVDVIAHRYAVEPSGVRVFLLPELQAIKISFPRPTLQGARDDRDMHAGQQYVPMLDLPVA